MSSNHLRPSSDPLEPRSKRSRTSEEPPQLDGLTFGTSQSSVDATLPPASVPSRFLHRWALKGRAQIKNAAHMYFPKNALVYHFVDVYEDVVEANGIGELNALVQTCQEFYSLPMDDTSYNSQLIKPEIVGSDTFSHAFKASVPQSSGQSFSTRTLSQELLDYLSESIIPDSKSPLEWWRTNAVRFPRLALMARDFLCIPGKLHALHSVSMLIKLLHRHIRSGRACLVYREGCYFIASCIVVS